MLNFDANAKFIKLGEAIKNHASQPIDSGLFDLCVGVPIFVSTYRGLTPVEHSVLNVKALVGAFNQEKVGALSVIVKLCMIFWNLRLKL